MYKYLGTLDYKVHVFCFRMAFAPVLSYFNQLLMLLPENIHLPTEFAWMYSTTQCLLFRPYKGHALLPGPRETCRRTDGMAGRGRAIQSILEDGAMGSGPTDFNLIPAILGLNMGRDNFRALLSQHCRRKA